MRLTKLYVRFFRSFNFDYERKANSRAKSNEWEMIGGAWFPFVRVDLDPSVTAVVGANESGKSHLIKAIKRALTGQDADRGDFCRYSTLFSVETGQVRTPDFGVEVELRDDADVAAVAGVVGESVIGERVTLLRLDERRSVLVDRDGAIHGLDEAQLASVESRLPVPFELETNIALPDSISLDVLIGREGRRLAPRKRRFELIDTLRALPEITADVLTSNAAQILGLFGDDASEDEADSAAIKAAELGRKLLVDVANIGQSAFEDLERALRDGQEGQVGGLIEEMNRSLARHLNFNRWWTQDPDFELRLAPRERELVFTIRDRTGTDYSFAERSRGLTYFLSYFVQLRAHKQALGNEVLLMDEPDAYLSSAGQQDLLRALEDFAHPDDGSRENQVVYVTHSPFLINKNAAQRIRVLDKGSNEEGTRVVRDVVRNHYEPLRSAIGGFVAETVFVGGTNLLVEGLSDQVLLAGATSLLRYRGVAPRDLLDLNEVTIVPAGSANGVPYMAYLARGRDELKPACVALLDGDNAGREAIRRLARSDDGNENAILKPAYVVDLGRFAEGAELKLTDGVVATEIEDLLPAVVVAEAAGEYAKHLLAASEEKAATMTTELVAGKISEGSGSMWSALEQAFAEAFDGAHIEKVGFAKEVVAILERVREQERRPAGLPDLEHNFVLLLAELSTRLAQAGSDEAELRSNRRSDRIVRTFLRDYPDGMSKDAAERVLRELETSLEMTTGDEAVRSELVALRRDFKLNTDPLTPVEGFEVFSERVGNLGTLRRMAYRPADSPPRATKADIPQSGEDGGSGAQ